MRCKSCDYRLWNLASRKCPECGTPFSPSEFEFVPNSVAFCCPQCNQAYYGTGPNGHLDPAIFDCASCGRPIGMNEMVLRPTMGVTEEQTLVDEMPWLARKKIGTVRAWFTTIGRAMVSPVRLMRSVPKDHSTVSAWWFATFTNVVFLMSGGGLIILFVLGGVVYSRSGRGGGGLAAGLAGVAGLGSFLLVPLVAIVLVMLFWGALAHGLLRLTGDTAGGIGRTYQGIYYGVGANALCAVPCLGIYLLPFSSVWWSVSALLMVKESQRVSGGRAALAVLVPPGLAVSVGITAYIALFAWMFSGSGPIAMASKAFVGLETQTVATAISSFRDANGQWPAHGLELISSDSLESWDLVTTDSNTYEEDVPVADLTLDQFGALSTTQKAEVLQAAIEALPAGVIAHRLGDFVFTYHGLDPSGADPNLWLVIMVPDPDSNAPPAPSDIVLAGRVGGDVLAIPWESFAEQLVVQNQLRESAGLSPLPDLLTVTHAQPAPARQP